MKRGASQSTVQSDATNIIPCQGLLSYVTVAASSRAPTLTTNLPWSQRRWSALRARFVGGRTGSGVEALAEFIMNELSDEFSTHALGKGVGGGRGCGGGGGGAGLAAFLAACAFFDVVDVPVVQVVDVGLSSSWTRLSCPLLCKTGVLVQTVQPGEFRSCSSWTRW